MDENGRKFASWALMFVFALFVISGALKSRDRNTRCETVREIAPQSEEAQACRDMAAEDYADRADRRN